MEERLNLNSNNSSKPPSTDRKKNKKKPQGGAVQGHPGRHRKLSEKFDKWIVVKLEKCQYCGSKNLQRKPPCITQQTEIPDIKPIVTQIERSKAKCRTCGKKLIAPMPEGYANSSFGPKLISVIGLLGACTGISFIDSTLLTVCHIRRANSNKVFKQAAKKGKSTTGWFFGLKLHLVINEMGDIIAYMLTAGNVSDLSPVSHLTRDCFGKLCGDKGGLRQGLLLVGSIAECRQASSD